MNLVLLGNGNMGKAVASLVEESGKHRVVARLDSKSALSPEAFQAADAVIEFTNAVAFLKNLPVLLQSGKPVVVGSTGWLSEVDNVRAQVLSLGGSLLYAANFSLGVQLFFRMVKHAAALIAPFPEFDAALSEIHHTAKKDSPSGTGLRAAALVLESLPRKTRLKTAVDSETPIAPDELLLTSIRLGKVFGTHTLHLDSAADEITISHNAKSRRGFAEGAIQAAEWLLDKKGFYSIDDFLSDRLAALNNTRP